MAEMPDLIAYQEKQQRQTAAKKPNLMAYQERQEAKKASAAPYNDILVQEARKYGASRARSERSSHRTANHADAERRAQAQVVSDTIQDKKGGMLGGTVNGWLAGQVGAAASGLEALQAADWAVSPEKASIDASRRNIENYTAKRDAAQTAEERARWQQLIDRNERLIAINSEAYAKKTADVENAVGKLGDTRAKLKSDAEYGIAKEKEGLGAIGRTAVDVGVAGGQMAMDALAGGLPSIATRVFGDSTQEAKETISPAATTAAQAPVRQAQVSPLPRSQTRILMGLSLTTRTNSVFTRSGNRGLFSNCGPICCRSSLSTLSTNTTQWGLPVATQVMLYSLLPMVTG